MNLSTSRIRAGVAAFALSLTVSGCGYNTIPTLEGQAKAKRGDVQNDYQRRADLIPNLVATVQGYAKQEKDVLTAVVEARAKATQITSSAILKSSSSSRMRRTSCLARSAGCSR
jgi:LemA protein